MSRLLAIYLTSNLTHSLQWLVANDRVEEARKILGKYHGEGKYLGPIVHVDADLI